MIILLFISCCRCTATQLLQTLLIAAHAGGIMRRMCLLVQDRVASLGGRTMLCP